VGSRHEVEPDEPGQLIAVASLDNLSCRSRVNDKLIVISMFKDSVSN